MARLRHQGQHIFHDQQLDAPCAVPESGYFAPFRDDHCSQELSSSLGLGEIDTAATREPATCTT